MKSGGKDDANGNVYDALQYVRQVSRIADVHRSQKGKAEHKNATGAEFISGFHKNDKLIPVITLVLFFNADEWDGPRSLMDMMEITNPTVRRLVGDYPIYLIDPRSLADAISCIAYSMIQFRTLNVSMIYIQIKALTALSVFISRIAVFDE